MPVKIEDFEDSKGKIRRHVEPSVQSRVPPEREKPRDVYGGPHTASYELFIQKLFTPGAGRANIIEAPNLYADSTGSSRYAGEIAKDKLNASLLYSPLLQLTDYGVYDKPEAKCRVYRTKSSAEYFATMNKKPMLYDSPSIGYKAAATASAPNCWDYTPTYDTDRYRLSLDTNRLVAPERTKQMLIDYKEFKSSPLSPYLYLRHAYVHGEDSRIVGSNFVQLSLRPNDNFLNKVDKTLAEAKKFNRWW